MRSSLLFVLSTVVIADQIPLTDKLKGWWKQATEAAASNVPTILPDPLDSGAAKVAELVVSHLNSSNWKDTLGSTAKAAEWLVYVGGENKTCYGNCVNATKAWNTSAAILAALPSGPSLGSINCEEDGLLCSTLAVTPPAIYHFVFSPIADPVARYIPINQTSITASEIVELHTKRAYETTQPYTGPLEPFTGMLAKFSLLEPYGYAMYAFSKMPAWLPMILISFLSRNMMGSRGMPQRRQGAAAPGTAAPAAAAK